jgi:predicted nucleic acid-binding protein
MTRRGLLDTSALLLMPRLDRAFAELPDEGVISTITLAELAVGPQVAQTESERAARIIEVQHAEADFEVLPFDAPAARVFGLVAADLRRAGRKPAARAFDAMIAAIAIANGLPLYTCNPADFVGILGLEVVAVEHPGSAT